MEDSAQDRSLADPKMDVLPHLVYEIWMLRSLAQLIQNRILRDVTNLGNSVESNAILESFIMHARVLHEFIFYPPDPKYVRARDYTEGAEFGAVKTSVLRDLEQRANSDAVHLGPGRLRDENWSWYPVSVAGDISIAFAKFLDRMKEPYLPRVIELLGKQGIKRDDLLKADPTSVAGLTQSRLDALRTHPPT